MSIEEAQQVRRPDAVVALSNLAHSAGVAPDTRVVLKASAAAADDLMQVMGALGVMTTRGLADVKTVLGEVKDDVEELREDIGDVKEELRKLKEERDDPYAKFFDTEQKKRVSPQDWKRRN